MAISIQQIINTSKSYSEATRSFNANYPNPTTSEGNEFLSKANSKFPTNTSSTSNTSITSNNGDTTDKTPTIAGKMFTGISEILETQEKSYEGITEASLTMSEAVKELVNNNYQLIKGEELINKLKEKAIKLGKEYYKNQTELLHSVNEGTSLTGKLSEGVRQELTDSNVELTKYGISFNEIVTSSLNYTQQTSKFNLINTETFDKVAQSAKAYVGTLGDLTNMLPDFEKIGYGASDTAKQIQISGQRIMKLGLDSKSMLKEVGQNLEKINQYGFKDGVQGLSNMVTKAKEFRMSMEGTFTIAEKVMNPEGAIDMAANLMAIGGAIGDLGDPLKMMYMATNNVEGIQDALIGATSSLATFNKEGGRFEVTGINLRKVRAIADATGADFRELSKGAIAFAERASAATDMLANGLRLDKDQTDLITNLSKMKDGKMVMEIQGDEMRKILGVKGDVKEIALENLTQTQAEQLAEYQKRESEKTPEDIIRGQATNVELIARDVHYMLKLITAQSARTLGKGIKEFAKDLGIEFDSETLSKDTKNLRNDVAEKTKTTFRDVNASLESKVQGAVNYGKTGLNKIMGVDNSQKEKEVKGDNTGGNSIVLHKHEIKESSVIFNNVKNLWEEQFSRKDAREYTGNVNLVANNKRKF